LSIAVKIPESAAPDFESEPDTFTDTDEVNCIVFAVAVTDQFVEFVYVNATDAENAVPMARLSEPASVPKPVVDEYDAEADP
jgi:hypothetical protein